MLDEGLSQQLGASATDPDVVGVSIMYDEQSTEMVGLVSLLHGQQRTSSCSNLSLKDWNRPNDGESRWNRVRDI